MGDGLLVHFGYPQARGDDVQRAVRAELNITDVVLRQLSWPVGLEQKLAVPIGGATGQVVVRRIETVCCR